MPLAMAAVRFTLKHVQPGCGNLACAQSMCQRHVVHDAAARNVHQRGRRLHQRQFRGADGVMRCSRVRHDQHHMVGAAQQFVLADIARLAFGLLGRQQR